MVCVDHYLHALLMLDLEEGKPCYMYLTITEDPSSSVIVNFHSRDTPVNSYPPHRLSLFIMTP